MSKILLSLDLMLIGIFTLVFITIHSLVGIRIISKYFKYKKSELILGGIGWVGAATAWMGAAMDFISILLFDSGVPIELNLLVCGGILPFTQLAWIAAMTKLTRMDPKKRKFILIAGAIIVAIFEPIYIYIVFTEPSIIGTHITPIQIDYALFSQVHYTVEIFVFILPGLWLARESLRSDKQDIKLKGKILLFTFLLSIILSFLELLAPTVLMFLIARSLAVVVSILFYAGFILPEWTKRIFLRQKNNE